MLSLEINKKTLRLLAGQKVSFDINNLIFDTEFLNGSRTSSYKIAVDDISQDTFGSPEAMASKSKTFTFQEFDASLSFNGIKLYSGKFMLRKATLSYYEGNFVFGVSDLVSKMSKPIAEVLGNESYVFVTTNTKNEMKKTITTADSPVVFPVLKLANKFYNTYKNNNFLLPRIVGDSGYPVPIIKACFILELLIKKLGYQLLNPNWASATPDARKLVFFNNRLLKVVETITTVNIDVQDAPTEPVYTIQEERVVLTVTENLIYADYLPVMTVAELLKAIKNLLGLFFEFDSFRKTVTIHFISDILQSDDCQDFTDKVSPQHEVLPNNYQGLRFVFDKHDDDKITDYLETPQTDLSNFTVLPEVEKVSQLPNPVTTPLYAVILVLESHRYFKNTLDGWQEWQYPWLDYVLQKDSADVNTVAKTNQQTITTGFSPVASNKGWHFLNKEGEILKSDIPGSYAKCLAIINTNQNYIVPAFFVFKESKVYKNQKRFAVLADASTNTDFDCPFYQKETVAYTRISYGNFILPESDFAATLDQKPPVRILLYHGLQTSPVNIDYNETPPVTVSSQRLYPMASADCYDNFGNKIADFALRWEGKHGLIEKFWKPFIAFKKLSRVFEVAAVLTLEDLRRFKPTQKIRIRESVFIVDKIETKIGDEVGFSRLTLVKIGSEIFDKPPLPPFGNLQLICTDTCNTSPNQNYFIMNAAQEVVSIIVCGQTIVNLPIGIYTVNGSVENMLISGTATVIAGQTVTVNLGGCPVPDPPPPIVVKFVYQIGNFGLDQQFITDIFQDNANIGVTSREFVKTIAGVETVVFLGDPMPTTNYLLRSTYTWNNGLVTLRNTLAKEFRSVLNIADNGFSSVDGNLQIKITFGSFYTADAANVRYSVIMTYENGSSDNFTVPVPISGNLTFIDVVRTLPQFGRTTFDVLAETLEGGVWTETNYVRSFVRIFI
jgi:hypothetical protein